LGLSKHWRAAEMAMSLATKCIFPNEEWEYHYLRLFPQLFRGNRVGGPLIPRRGSCECWHAYNRLQNHGITHPSFRIVRQSAFPLHSARLQACLLKKREGNVMLAWPLPGLCVMYATIR
jgi:hypothetical protein